MDDWTDEELDAQNRAEANIYRDGFPDPDNDLPPLPSPSDVQEQTLSWYIGHFQDEYDDEEYALYYRVGRYGNGRIALDIDCENTDDDGSKYYEPYARVTVNLPDMDIPENLFSDSCGTDAHQEHAFINGDCTEKFKQWLRDNNIISYPLRTVKYNYGTYELCEILVKE